MGRPGSRARPRRCVRRGAGPGPHGGQRRGGLPIGGRGTGGLVRPRRSGRALSRIGELQALIAAVRPRTLTGTAVVLRRALAAIGDPGKVEARLVGAALGVVAAGKRVTGVVT